MCSVPARPNVYLSKQRNAIRLMLRTPLFTATVVLTVAIAIAANATIFTVVNAVMIRSLPFAQPDRIMQVAARGDPMVGVAGGVRGNS